MILLTLNEPQKIAFGYLFNELYETRGNEIIKIYSAKLN